MSFKVGDIVRLRHLRDHVEKRRAGSLVTIRALGTRSPDRAVRVDDGDPADPELDTNGWTWTSWLPLEAIEPLRRAAPAGGSDVR